MISHTTKVRVRYADTDKMGVVYYSNYAVYYEVARTEMFRELGFPYSEMEKAGIALPVKELSCKYHKSARYDELLSVEARIETMPTAKVVFNYEIKNEAGELLNEGSTTLVFVNIETGRPTRVPKVLAAAMEKYF
ncbi:MAG: acyl-CoA thioesterase [Bacteroidales bacterium]|nr:acyl-CoA thioesterase [Bacteroidales bacterium]